MLEKHRATAEERAFPVPVGVVTADMQGMSLRDWFAGQALAGVCANSNESADQLAGWAYKRANSMMEARKKFG